MKKQLIAVFCLVSMAFSTAWAAPTAQLFGGKTTVSLAPEFVDALVSLGVTPSDVYPGTLNLDTGTAAFPISGGALDLETLAGEISHKGGLGLGVPGTEVALISYTIDTTEQPILTGVASVNGDLVGRLPLFDLNLESATVSNSGGGVIRVDDVAVTLNAAAADTLNAVFGVNAFVGGLEIGSASVLTRAIPVQVDDGSDGMEDVGDDS